MGYPAKEVDNRNFVFFHAYNIGGKGGGVSYSLAFFGRPLPGTDYGFLPMRYRMKKAEKHNTAMISEITSWNTISTSCDPRPYNFGAIENGERTSHKDKHLEYFNKLVFGLRQSVKSGLGYLVTLFEGLVYSVKFRANASSLPTLFLHSSNITHAARFCKRYFLGFGGFFSGAWAFLGRPLPGTLRMDSTTEGSYKALYDNGLIPSFSIRLCAVFQGISSFSAISSIVIPFISLLSAILLMFMKNVEILRYLLYRRLAKYENIFKNIVLFRNFILTYIVTLRYFYSMS